MNYRKTYMLLLCMIPFAILIMSGCAKNAETVQISSTITRDEKFGVATINLSQEEFEKAGFVLGDSCDVEFGSGLKLTGIPYYNGYYVRTGQPLIVAYPNSAKILVTYNNVPIWDVEHLQEGDTITITRRKAGEFKVTQEALGQSYSVDRAEYGSDEEFCNFRSISGGIMKKNILYRGASPVDNSRGRAAYTDALLEKNGIRSVVDLADSAEDIAGYMSSEDFASPFVSGLLAEEQVVLLNMGSSYMSEAYQKKVAEGMRHMLKAGLPAYIHCMEGKDRTGFVCMLLEALCGATYDEMLADYMKTYENYYSITKENTAEKYTAIADLYFFDMTSYLHGSEDREALKKADYSADAAAYLKKAGMSDAEIEDLKKLLTE